MRIFFEEWLSSIQISEVAKEIFDEAIACYRFQAYRASLLLSYMGFKKS